MIDEGVDPETAYKIAEGIMPPPSGIELPQILKQLITEPVTIAGISVGVLLLIGLGIVLISRR